MGVRYGHGGFFPGYRAAMAYFPEKRVAVAVLINSTAPGTKNFSQQFILDAVRTISEHRSASAMSSSPRSLRLATCWEGRDAIFEALTSTLQADLMTFAMSDLKARGRCRE